METRRMLALCAAYLEENGMEFSFSEKGESGQTTDLLILPGFQTEPVSGEQMEMAVCVPERQNAFVQQMQVKLMHMVGCLPSAAQAEPLRELRALLGAINLRMPVGAFDADADGNVLLRYALPVPEEMEEAPFLRQFAAALSLLNAYALAFMTPIVAVSRGECTAKAALELADAQLQEMIDGINENGVMK